MALAGKGVTPLVRIIAGMIAAEGPMPLDRYMALCLGHPQHGYYLTRDPFGAKGDFITAPEVSQMFGELIGVWCATAWRELGQPARFNLVELGPGRATLMADVLRAGSKVPGFAEAARVCLVETSPVLRRAQAAHLGDRAAWFDALTDVPSGPMILIANEFFDAIPVRQLQSQEGGWLERCVGLAEDGRFRLGLVPAPHEGEAEEGAILEVAPQRDAMAREIGRRLADGGGMALIIDYGHLWSGFGDTLQAVRAHRPIGILDAPGESDLTAHVDFEALAEAMRGCGAAVHAPMTQRDFLIAMGLEQRAAVLATRDAEGTRNAVERLAGPAQMGNLFKVIAATAPGTPPPYPFGAS